MSKKEIRRAARDAFPKAKNASSKGRGTGGAYAKRSHTVSPRTAGGRPVPGPPSVVRSLMLGVVAGVLYFVLIQWVIRIDNATTASNILVGAVGTVLFTGANYLAAKYRYRRYLKQKDSCK